MADANFAETKPFRHALTSTPTSIRRHVIRHPLITNGKSMTMEPSQQLFSRDFPQDRKQTWFKKLLALQASRTLATRKPNLKLLRFVFYLIPNATLPLPLPARPSLLG